LASLTSLVSRPCSAPCQPTLFVAAPEWTSGSKSRRLFARCSGLPGRPGG
jgi:hypothetical protein